MTHLRTLSELAKFTEVTTKTVGYWRDNFADFPSKSKSGYLQSEIESFCKKHEVGKFNPNRVTREERLSLRELTIKKISLQADNLLISNERAMATQARELANILLSSDVEADLAEIHRIVLETIQFKKTEVENLLCDSSLPAELQEKVLLLIDKAIDSIRHVSNSKIGGVQNG